MFAFGGETLKIATDVQIPYLVGPADSAVVAREPARPAPSVPVIESNQSSLVPISLQINATTPALTLTTGTYIDHRTRTHITARALTRHWGQTRAASGGSSVVLSIGNIVEVRNVTRSIVAEAHIQRSGAHP